jgi:hypothetical protein
MRAMISLMPLRSFIANNIYGIQIFLCIVGACSCLLPLYIQDSYVENTKLSRSLNTIEFTAFSACCISLAAPLLLNQIIDRFLQTFGKKSCIGIKSSVKVLFATDIEQLIFIFGVLVVPIITLFPLEFHHDTAFLYICCVKSQNILSVGIVMISIGRYDKGFWPTLLISVALLFQILGIVIAAFVANLYEQKPVTRLTSICRNYDIFMNIAASIIFWTLCAHHMVKIFRRKKSEADPVKPDTIKKAVTYDFFMVAYIAGIFAVSIYMVIVGLYNPHVVDLTVSALILSSLPFGICILFLEVFLMRIVKFDMTEVVVSFLQNSTILLFFLFSILHLHYNFFLNECHSYGSIPKDHQKFLMMEDVLIIITISL